MRLPDNYQCVKDDDGDRWLYENVWMLRSVPRELEPVEEKCPVGPLAGQYVRPVARFPQAARIRDVEDVALYDQLSRSPYYPRSQRQQAREWLARRFTECRV